MNEDDFPALENSPLEGAITRDGKTVFVHIYRAVGDDAGWTLEIEDEFSNSTVYDDFFATDQEAFDLANSEIDDEGIDSLIGLSARTTLAASRGLDDFENDDDFQNDDGPDPEPYTYSGLSGPYPHDGQVVYLEIFKGEDGLWITEVLDLYGKVTELPGYESETEAYERVIEEIDRHGVERFIEADDRPGAEGRRTLSDAETIELDEALANSDRDGRGMLFSMLNGYLTALAIGPEVIPPSAWLPRVWDFAEGVAEPNFRSTSHAQRVLSLIFRHWNSIVEVFENDPRFYILQVTGGEGWSARDWCLGFTLGMQMCEPWTELVALEPEFLEEIARLATIGETDLEVSEDDDMESLMLLEDDVLEIYYHWLDARSLFEESSGTDSYLNPMLMPAPQRRNEPKVGRNDPCPCGSGRKFKKCHGAGESPPLH